MSSADGNYIQNLLRSNQYVEIDKTKNDILEATRMYRGLTTQPGLSDFNNEPKKTLLNLTGTIPIRYKGNKYNIPIVIWLLDTHPTNAPVVFVKPTTDMRIKVSRHVDRSGEVYLQYLHDWSSSSSNLLGLIQALISTFSEQPPVFAVPPGTPPQPPIFMRCDENYIQQILYSNQYKEISNTRMDILEAIRMYDCLSPKPDHFVFNNGTQKTLVSLNGIIPIEYKGNSYNIPIVIWLLDTHPKNAPMVFVKPTTDMRIKVSRHVDHNGNVNLSYLHDWSSSNCSLLGLIQVLISTFSEQPPVVAVPPGTPPQPPASMSTLSGTLHPVTTPNLEMPTGANPVPDLDGVCNDDSSGFHFGYGFNFRKAN